MLAQVTVTVSKFWFCPRLRDITFLFDIAPKQKSTAVKSGEQAGHSNGLFPTNPL